MKLWESFDQNEVILLIMTIIAYLAYFLMKRKPGNLAPQIRILSLMWGLTIGVLYDFTIGGGQTDFYRVNDLNNYEVTDVIYYLLFAPFGYFFFYLYERLKISKKNIYYLRLGLGSNWSRDSMAFDKGGNFNTAKWLPPGPFIPNLFIHPDDNRNLYSDA
ncbi:hypothetical protein [Cytobacillus oceanisediminis]|uniref:hypothetical protein n=1 Tax=Cytobacillus oceanisediminis TaxID=665099 RepID=UPI003736F4D7